MEELSIWIEKHKKETKDGDVFLPLDEVEEYFSCISRELGCIRNELEQANLNDVGVVIEDSSVRICGIEDYLDG